VIHARPALSLRILCVWLFISAFYYTQTLFSGEFILDFDEGFAHKFTKYVVCGAISAYLILRSRNLAAGGFSLFMLVLVSVHLLTGGIPNLFATTVLTLATMAGFSCTLQVYPAYTREIARAVVFSAAAVGCLSVIELTLLADKFLGYWAATGGIRSISTMFNPNNLGLYLGAAILILPWVALSRGMMLVLSVPILFGLAASGSRTAWVSMIVCLLVLFFLPNAGRGMREVVIRYRWYLGFLLAIMVATMFLVMGAINTISIESEGRGGDLLTANIRWENFVAYLEQIDGNSLLPDLSDKRVAHIQDNVYLVFFNTFGLVCFIVLSIVLGLGLRTGPRLPDNGRFAWGILTTYYLVSGLSGSFINSFPNNQLFFIALGGFLVPRAIARRKVAGVMK
jgi:hypothetical protein